MAMQSTLNVINIIVVEIVEKPIAYSDVQALYLDTSKDDMRMNAYIPGRLEPN
jgi:hypothetical protein